MSLKEMICGDPFPRSDTPLIERVQLAHKFAEAVFFLHAAGCLHKKYHIFERCSSPTISACWLRDHTGY